MTAPEADWDSRAGERVERAGVAVPDGWDRLWTPHRLAYLRGENRPPDDEAGQQCPFCRVPALDDDDSLVVTRGSHAFAVLNLYPYNPGHLMVCPYRHVGEYPDLTDDETADVARLTKQSMRTLRVATSAHGFNIGMNQGRVAGAGIAGHLHQHVVPRWGGDTNFMPVVSGTKAMAQVLSDTRDMLAAAWQSC